MQRELDEISFRLEAASSCFQAGYTSEACDHIAAASALMDALVVDVNEQRPDRRTFFRHFQHEVRILSTLARATADSAAPPFDLAW